MSDESYSYIALKPCGCLAMAVVDHPGNRQFVASEVAKAIRLGEAVERVTSETVRTMPWFCEAHAARQETLL